MKQWQNYHFVLTATSIPVALMICWWIFKKKSNADADNRMDNPHSKLEAEEDLSCSTDVNSDLNGNAEEKLTGEENLAKDCVKDVEEATLEQVAKNPEDVSSQAASEKLCVDGKSNSDEVSVVANPDQVDAEETISNLVNTPDNLPICMSSDGSKVTPGKASAVKVSEERLLKSNMVTAEVSASMCASSHALNVDQHEQGDSIICETKNKVVCDELEIAVDSKEDKLVAVDQKHKNIAVCDAELSDMSSQGQSPTPVDNATQPVCDSPNSVVEQSQHSRQVNGNDDEDSAVERDADTNVNANNSNNATAVDTRHEHTDINGSEDSGCDCCKAETIKCTKAPCTNGWHTVDNSESSEDNNDVADSESNETIESKDSMRPLSLTKLRKRTSSMEENFEVFVEFPSDRVGLLIGKQGRNIKQLKIDSGADVYVVEAPGREDIQVLQICGTQSEVESCVSRIKRRFSDISLNHFDATDMLIPSPNPAASPMTTMPPMMYPVANISQLRLPDGITVEVVVSAIADVDRVFVQQYTHPTFHALPNLERAMEACYADPSIPTVPNPVQVGMVCTMKCQDVWYRAQIVQSFEESDNVVVRFVDYGGFETVPHSSLKQIRADFITLPFQATECYMDNIASPNESKFCEDSVKKLQEMLQNGRFQARVTGYRSDGIPRIHLFKCLRNGVFLINQEMATKGLATWTEPAPFPCA